MPRLGMLTAVLIAAACVPSAPPAPPALIGLIQGISADLAKPRLDALRSGLDTEGLRDGRDYVIDQRLLEGKGQERAAELTRELIAKGARVIVTGNPAGVDGARQVTTVVPIVLAGVGVDPIGHGWVSSLARPGGNITGLSFQTPASPGKRLQLLTEIVPGARRLGLLHDATSPPSVTPDIENAARSLGIELEIVPVRDANGIEAAFATFASGGIAGVLVTVGAVTPQHFERIAALAIRHRIATISGVLESSRAGGLLALAPEQTDLYRRAARYVAKILKGARPGDLPLEQPEKFELIVNLMTARAIGRTIPDTILAQASEVIR